MGLNPLKPTRRSQGARLFFQTTIPWDSSFGAAGARRAAPSNIPSNPTLRSGIIAVFSTGNVNLGFVLRTGNIFGEYTVGADVTQALHVTVESSDSAEDSDVTALVSALPEWSTFLRSHWDLRTGRGGYLVSEHGCYRRILQQ